MPCRLEDDDRLDALLDQLEKRAPSLPQPPGARPTPKGAAQAAPSSKAAGSKRQAGRARPAAAAGAGRPAGGASGADRVEAEVLEEDGGSVSSMSVKSALAQELRAVRDRIRELELRAARKAQQAFT